MSSVSLFRPGMCLLVAVVISMATGCAPSSDEGIAKVPSGSTGLVEAAFDPVDGVPLDGRVEPVSGEEIAYIARAELRAVQRCMEELGFRYPFEESTPQAPAVGYLTPTELRRSGYLVDAGSLASVSERSAVDEMLEEMTPAEQVAWHEAFMPRDAAEIGILDGSGDGVISVSTGGCLASGRAELYGSIENYLRYDRAVQLLEGGGVAEELAKVPEFDDAADGWRACMRREGYDVADYDAYGFAYLQRRGIAEGAGGGPLTDDEVRAVSVADADCQERVGLDQVREALLDDARAAVAGRLSIKEGAYVAFQRGVLERAVRLGY